MSTIAEHFKTTPDFMKVSFNCNHCNYSSGKRREIFDARLSIRPHLHVNHNVTVLTVFMFQLYPSLTFLVDLKHSCHFNNTTVYLLVVFITYYPI